MTAVEINAGSVWTLLGHRDAGEIGAARGQIEDLRQQCQ